jgi:hypothetical protein
MSLKQMREGWGKFNYEDVHQLMEKWGYHHNNNWDPIDFDMLIDRILLLESVETIAEKREIDVSTVKRKTKYLADLLQLTLPRASYKKRSQR